MEKSVFPGDGKVTIIIIILVFVFYLILGAFLVPTLSIMMASFLVTTKTLGYPISFLSPILGYAISGIITLWQIITQTATILIITPFLASIGVAITIFIGTMIYEKIRYHEIFYPYQGD